MLEKLSEYYIHFIKEMDDYKELSMTEFVLKYCDLDNSTQKEIDELYDIYKNEYEDDPQDMLEKGAWIREVYEEEYEDDLQQIIDRNFDYLDIERYQNVDNSEDVKIELTLATWWPHIQLNIDCYREHVEYCIYWWWDRYENNCNEYYNSIMDAYQLHR